VRSWSKLLGNTVGAGADVRREAVLGNSLVLVGTGSGAVPDPTVMLPAQGAPGQQYFGRRKYYWATVATPYDAPMKPTGPGLVATATAWAALVLGLVLAALSLPIDDFWLSLASAHRIANGADLARAIDLTWIPTIPGAINPQWGAQLLLGAPGSAWGALAINGALIGAGLVLTLVRARRRAGPAAASIAMLLMMGALAPHLLARAQSFSIALLPLALLLLERRPAARWLPVAYGILMVAWANLHGAFVIGQMAAAAYFVAELIRRSRRAAQVQPGLLGTTLLVALVAPLANPAGLVLLAYAYGQPGLDVVRSISVEWQPAWPWVPVAAIFWAYLALIVAGRMARRGAIGLGQGLLATALGLFAVYSLRQIPWFLLATTPLLAADIEALLAARPRVAVGEVGGPLGGARAWALPAAAFVAVVLLQPMRVVLPEAIGRVTLNEPVAIGDVLVERLRAGSHERLLNEQVWGGYLAYRLGDRVETAMDGRLEIRSRETWVTYFALMHGDDDPAAELSASAVNWAALAPDRATLISKLGAAGWTVELRTADQVLLHRP
jgi:hypothetical protein